MTNAKPQTTNSTILSKEAILDLSQNPGEITSEIMHRLMRTAQLYWELKGEIDDISKRYRN